MSTKRGSALKLLAQALEQLIADGEAPLDAKGKTRARIVRSAAEHFTRNGYRRANVDDIARDAGVAKGTIYVHFKSKNELLLGVIMDEKRRMAPRFRDLLLGDHEPAERLRRYIEASVVSVHEAPLSAKLMSGDREMMLFLEEMGPEQRAQMAQNQVMFGELLNGVGDFDELPPAEQERRRTVLIAFLYNAWGLADEPLRGGIPLDEFARQIAKIIVDGVGAP